MVMLSVIMPTIRTQLLHNVYNSLVDSFHGTWELVLVGPNPVPQDLLNTGHVRWIQSYRSPIVCRQQALLAAEGEWICYAADDVTFIRASLDIAYQNVERHNLDYKFIVVGKYLENVNARVADNVGMRQDNYYHLNFHDDLKEIMSKFPDWLLINTGLVSKKLLLEVGGWDCDFEACAMACCDLSLRLQNYGATCFLQHEPIFISDWEPERQGDHAPIHDAQTEHDIPMFMGIWKDPASVDRKVVDLNKWQSMPEKWVRRFNW